MTTGAGGRSRRASISSSRRMREISATYRAPSRTATPLALSSPRATMRGFAARAALPAPGIAYTTPLSREPTKSVPAGEIVSDRAPGRSSAKTSSVKPGGSVMRSTIRPAARAAADRRGAAAADLRRAAGHGHAGASGGRGAIGPAAAILVLLPALRRLLPQRADVRGALDQGPREGAVTRKALLFAAPLALLLGACATVPTGPSMMVLPGTGKPFDQFQADDAACRQWALR